jgi:hypothetical protein
MQKIKNLTGDVLNWQNVEWAYSWPRGHVRVAVLQPTQLIRMEGRIKPHLLCLDRSADTPCVHQMAQKTRRLVV